MGSRFIRPKTIRLQLADVHRRAHAELLKRKIPKVASAEEIAASEARVAHAETLGDWIEVRERLNTGEYRARLARMSHAVGNELQLNRIQLGISTVTAFLLDWSLKDDDGSLVTIRGLSIDDLTSVLDNLDPDAFAEIREAIEAHENTVDAEKNGQGDGSKLPVISPSPSGVTGGTSGLQSSSLMSTTSS